MSHKKEWRVVYDGGNFIDGEECETFNEASNRVIEILDCWLLSFIMDNDIPRDVGLWNEKQIDDWGYFVHNCGAWVERLNRETREYEEYWFPSEEECISIGWMDYEMLKKYCKKGEMAM